MPRSKGTPMAVLRAWALRHPETDEGIACAGTPLEKRTVKVRNKAFVFPSAADARVKLGDSYAEAKALGAGEPQRCAAGGHRWVKGTFAGGGAAALNHAKAWIDESCRMFAPKSLLRSVREGGENRS